VIGEAPSDSSDKKDYYILERYIEPSYLNTTDSISHYDIETCQRKSQWVSFRDEKGILVEREHSYSYSYPGAASNLSDAGYEYEVTETIVDATETESGGTLELISEYTYVVEWKEQVEEVTVPAGTFECERKLKYDTDGELMKTSWYSDKAKRIVKSIDHRTEETMELIWYSIADT
jgi:hypothetical protein